MVERHVADDLGYTLQDDILSYLRSCVGDIPSPVVHLIADEIERLRISGDILQQDIVDYLEYSPQNISDPAFAHRLDVDRKAKLLESIKLWHEVRHRDDPE